MSHINNQHNWTARSSCHLGVNAHWLLICRGIFADFQASYYHVVPYVTLDKVRLGYFFMHVERLPPWIICTNLPQDGLWHLFCRKLYVGVNEILRRPIAVTILYNTKCTWYQNSASAIVPSSLGFCRTLPTKSAKRCGSSNWGLLIRREVKYPFDSWVPHISAGSYSGTQQKPMLRFEGQHALMLCQKHMVKLR